MPNLSQRSGLHLRHLWKRWVWGLKKSRSPASNPREKTWMTTYGITSGIYRIFVFGAVLLFVADQFLILGLLMAVACAVGWIIAPALRLIRYLSTHPELDKNRRRAVLSTAGIVAAVLGFLQFFPWPRHLEAEGIVESTRFTPLVTESAGYVAEVKGRPGEMVRTGEVLVTLENPELQSRLKQARAAEEELNARLRFARHGEPSAILPLEKRLAATRENLAELQSEAASLQVVARQDGVWSFLHAGSMEGMWIPRGTPLGLVIEPADHEFTGVVRQADSGPLFDRKITLTDVEVRVQGQAAAEIRAAAIKPNPAGQVILPAASLGAKAGGDIPVMGNDETGRRASERFYLVKVPLESHGEVKLLHGQSGVVRFKAGTEALLPGWIRSLRQLLQRRYQM